jgi:vitamin B12/bleomycin/antimicrobial peptide transport system ATP-binding/permease protein
LETGVFGLLAAGSTALAVAQLSLTMRLQLGWRRWLSSRMLDRWLAYARHYQLGFILGDHANPDQRIADDARIACEAIVDLGAGAFNALLMFGCFIGVLWNLSGTLLVPLGAGFRVDGYMVWAALLYAAIGTGLTTLVGRPLARLSAAKLAAEGVYRSDLVRVNENAEGIALMGGERDERHTLNRLFDALADRWVTLRRGTCNVAWLTTGFSLTGLIFPALVASPLYLAGDMTMGGLMQAVAAMVHVQTALSWAVTNFARIADLRASAARITALVDVLNAIDADRVDPHADRIVTRTGARRNCGSSHSTSPIPTAPSSSPVRRRRSSPGRKCWSPVSPAQERARC